MKQRGQKSTAALAAAMAKPSVITGGFGSAKANRLKGCLSVRSRFGGMTVKGESPDLLNSSTAKEIVAGVLQAQGNGRRDGRTD